MFGIKKKLSALIPSDARAHLQNALTVEWEGGNKTVLVEVPDAPNAPSEMEMSGMGGGKGGGVYGRLLDDDDESDTYLRPEPPSRSRSHRSQHDRHERDLPSDPFRRPSPISHSSSYNSSSSYSSYSSKTLPALPSQRGGADPLGQGGQAQAHSRTANPARAPGSNPFDGDFYPSPQTSSSSTYEASPYTSSSPRFPSDAAPNSASNPYATYAGHSSAGKYGGGGYGGNPPQASGGRPKAGNPWATFRTDEVDLLGGDLGGGVDSPTSSRGTRDSDGSEAGVGGGVGGRNPFR
ncbi:hypothetical protein IAT38_005142 [Cryptococcus sp. DSM 104549]